MKNVCIIHGCPGSEEDFSFNKHWMPWTKQQLEEQGIKTIMPIMPTPWAPNYEVFKKEFEKNDISKDTILIGHSCGCAFLVRWLGESKQKIDKLILVAPWKIPSVGNEIKKLFYNYEIDESIKSRVNEIVMFTSDTEEERGHQSLKMYHDVLGGEIISLESRGHYTFRDMGTDEFPELISVIVK